MPLILLPCTLSTHKRRNKHKHLHTIKYTYTENLSIKEMVSTSWKVWEWEGQSSDWLSDKSCHQLRDTSVSLDYPLVDL